MYRLLVLPCLYLLLQGCMPEEAIQPSQEPDSVPAVGLADSTLHKVADDRTAGSKVPSQYSYRDPKTGTTYLMNPNWGVLQRRPKGLAKASGLVQSWFDWSGQVETRIYRCISPTVAQHQNSIGCQVEPDFILVGGGAVVDYGNGPGALLWETRPLDATLSTWVASSKDQISASPHTLYTYAIGMRLKDNNGYYIPKASLLGTFVFFYSLTSNGLEHYPNTYIQEILVNGSYYSSLYLGGGARANWNCCGSLLTQSFVVPLLDNASRFYAASKDHGRSDPSSITAYGIGMKANLEGTKSKYITNFGQLEFKFPSNIGNSVPTGVAVAYLDADPEFVVTGPGGQSVWTTGPGRLLFGIEPTGTYTEQIGVYSKDHKYVSGGYNLVSFTEVRKSH